MRHMHGGLYYIMYDMEEMEKHMKQLCQSHSHISDVEEIGIFNDYVVHVNGVELGEVPGERN